MLCTMEKPSVGGGATGGTCTSSVPKIMVFRPTLEEMQDFSKYLEHMESMGAHKAGLAKIIPPKEWIPRKGGYDDIDMEIPSPISQVVSGGQGLYQQYNIQKKSMSVKDFRRVAQSDRFSTPPHFDYEDLERKYWKNIAFNPPIYGADVSGSLYDPGVKEFNINHLNTILDLVGQDYGIKIEGVNTAYLYFGMWKTTFAWHTEDMDLYSINYLHFGAPKSWYCVPPEHGRRLERLAAGFFHNTAQECSAFLRHKMTVISPQVLRQYSIPYNKITQEAGEFMITFPYGYHAGFNHGFNCAESTNFALPRWVEYGKRASQCLCRNDCVKISMDVFVKKFQPDRYELWLAGQDVGCHPEDPSSRVPARAPTHIEMAMLRSMIKSKSKRHPVLSKHCLVPEEDAGDTDGTEIYDPEDDEDTKKQRRPSKGSLSKRKGPPKGAAQGRDKKRPRKPRTNSTNDGDACPIKGPASRNPAQYTSLMQELSIVVEPLAYKGPPKLEPLKASPAEAPSQSEPTQLPAERCEDVYQHTAELPALSLGPGGSLGDQWSLMTPVEALVPAPTPSPNHLAPLLPPSPPEETSALPFSKVANEKEEEVTRTPGMPRKLCLSTAVRRQPLHPAPKKHKSHPALIKGPGEDSSDEGWSSGGDTSGSKANSSSSSSAAATTMSGGNNNNNNGNGSLGAREPGSWAAPYMDLWSFRPANLYAERQLNRYSSTLEPHCALCLLFRPIQYSREETPREQPTVPESSAVWMPAVCFVNGGLDVVTSAEVGMPEIPDTDVKSSELLICTSCSVCVHKHCYGVTVPVIKETWKCDRCAVQPISVECCLCSLRGGALKQTTHGRWVHLLCALLVPEVHLIDQRARSPVDVLRVTPQRARLRCTYCHKLRDRLGCPLEFGACIQCTSGKCTTAFHVTCAHAAGVSFFTSDWPLPIFIKCIKHGSTQGDTKRAPAEPLPPVEPGSRVVAKHKNGRYYWGRVQECRREDLYSVVFEDNSSCDNLRPVDIVDRDCMQAGPPNLGDIVQVNWTDGKLYHAVFKGHKTVNLYTVVFEDESERTAKREDIYVEGEELPKRVKSSLKRPKGSTLTCSKNSRWKVVAAGPSTYATSTTTSCFSDERGSTSSSSSSASPEQQQQPLRCPPLYLRRESTPPLATVANAVATAPVLQMSCR
ncbi:lysine-specific demethylase 4C isoform X4 [Rhipicephalus microplus]|uniref:lysine-specific demethylase 4C isoform X4 n=1 Tax=Rhipicephalus microplus TaxID=6941 RepID=UPI001888C0A3|nr:lysine-specific demethylase 4A-like isoform X3 [Rhipicephalus microplus]